MNEVEMKAALKELTDSFKAAGHASADIYRALIDHAGSLPVDEAPRDANVGDVSGAEPQPNTAENAAA